MWAGRRGCGHYHRRSSGLGSGVGCSHSGRHPTQPPAAGHEGASRTWRQGQRRGCPWTSRRAVLRPQKSRWRWWPTASKPSYRTTTRRLATSDCRAAACCCCSASRRRTASRHRSASCRRAGGSTCTHCGSGERRQRCNFGHDVQRNFQRRGGTAPHKTRRRRKQGSLWRCSRRIAACPHDLHGTRRSACGQTEDQEQLRFALCCGHGSRRITLGGAFGSAGAAADQAKKRHGSQVLQPRLAACRHGRVD